MLATQWSKFAAASRIAEAVIRGWPEAPSSPVQGNGVFFSYDRPHPSTRTLHGGAPVTAGEKWVATRWLREGKFQ